LAREGGVRSVLARGARRSNRRFGTTLDLFVEGSAHLHVKAGRELDSLDGFDVVRARPTLGEDLGRFTGAAAVAELVLRFGRDDTDLDLYDTVAGALDALAVADAAHAAATALAGAWRVLGALGFTPSLEQCIECHDAFDADQTVLFSHSAGGALCDGCARVARVGRRLPPEARATLRLWLDAGCVVALGDAEVRAHQRLLREFVQEHLGDDRPLRAFEVWERALWSAA